MHGNSLKQYKQENNYLTIGFSNGNSNLHTTGATGTLQTHIPQTLTSLALEAGYLVQPHFNKDFKHFTGQTPGESYVVAGADKQVRKEAVTENNLKLVSNVFLRAASIEKAVELAKDCPILAYGGSVEVKEIPAVAANVAR